MMVPEVWMHYLRQEIDGIIAFQRFPMYVDPQERKKFPVLVQVNVNDLFVVLNGKLRRHIHSIRSRTPRLPDVLSIPPPDYSPI